MQRLIAIFLLLLLPLHSFAMQEGWLVAGYHDTIAHELEHRQGIDHHHEKDGTIHYDDSEESVEHISDQAASQLAFTLPSSGIQPLGFAPLFIAKFETWQYIPDPIPELPQRPPSSSLG